MRLANNYLGRGLAGIQKEARIPECEDLHGVHDSGTPRMLRWEHMVPSVKAHRVDMPVESGGITILRPLLGHTKDRLVATCEDANTRWVEDHTNKDRSLTLRNTVRYLHEANLLPVALRRPNLCAIAARTSDSVAMLEARVDEIFRSFDARLDPRSGHAVCIISLQTASEINAMPNCDHIKAMLLRKLLLLVVPTETMDLSTLETASSAFLEMDEGLPDKRQSAPIVAAGATAVRLEDSKGAIAYEIRRTPPPRNAKESRLDLKISLPLQSRQENAKQVSWSDWRLWDERYWIRMGSSPRDDAQTLDVVVRLLTPKDLNSLRKELPPQKFLLKTLASVKGHLRTTLPVIVQILPDEQSRIVALPSLDWSRHMWFSHVKNRGSENAQYYEIRYKHLDDSLTIPMGDKQNVY
jgi:tRNA(Ile)-lysidine synthase